MVNQVSSYPLLLLDFGSILELTYQHIGGYFSLQWLNPLCIIGYNLSLSFIQEGKWSTVVRSGACKIIISCVYTQTSLCIISNASSQALYVNIVSWSFWRSIRLAGAFGGSKVLLILRIILEGVSATCVLQEKTQSWAENNDITNWPVLEQAWFGESMLK